MEKLISRYTLLYIVLIFCSSILQIVPGIALLREGYIFFLFFACIIYLHKIRLKKINLLLILYFFSNFISYLISSKTSESLPSFILYISGPLIFMFLTSIPLSENTINSIEKRIKQLFILFIIIAILIRIS